MDSSRPMTLPKGIVTNTVNVYREVASHPIIPADRIYEYWHVYTTTNKKLKDPTARRLENFWWHVWGSDRRLLSGSTLAKIYEDISVGPTVVPLRGPPDRWEGPDVPPLTRRMVLSHLTQEQLAQQSRSSPLDAQTSVTSLKSPASSDCKPLPPPMLRKARGPSASGPRLTARFISPHESADEGNKDNRLPPSRRTAATGLETALPAGFDSKNHPMATKKSSTVAKRRPVLPRRTGSPSTAALEIGAQEGDSWGSSRTPGVPRVVSPIPETSSSRVDTGPYTVGSRVQNGMNTDAVGKKPVAERRRMAELIESLEPQRHSSTWQKRKSTGRAGGTNVICNLSGHGKSETDSKPARGNGGFPTGPVGETGSAPMMGRSHSHTGHGHYSEQGIGRAFNQSLFTGATASTTNIAAQGTIIDQSGVGSMSVSFVVDRQPSKNDLLGRLSASPLLDSRLTPTQPSSAASLPLGRTRSQLTLLLEREKAKMGEKPRPSN